MRRLLVLIPAALLLLGGVARAEPHDTLTIGLSSFPSMLHPYINPEVVKNWILSMATRPVTARDASWVLGCMVCSELPTLDNGLAKPENNAAGEPAMGVTIKLKPDLQWGDGVPVTTKDIAFTVKVARDPASGFADGRPWKNVEKIDVIDDHTAVLHLSAVDTRFNSIGDLLPQHIEEPIYDKAGAGGYIQQTAYNRDQTNPGLYNGPYLISQYQSGSQIVLTPNPHWAGKKPYFRQIVFRTIEKTAALQANLESGDVDLAPSGIGLPVRQVLDMRQKEPTRFSYVFNPALIYLHLDTQLDSPILSDIRVRRALLMGIDRKTIVQKLYDGTATVANSWLAPKDPNFTKDVQAYPFDPAAARALLAEAGWKPGPDGVARNDKGDRLALDMAGVTGNTFTELLEQVMQQNLKQIGADISIRNEQARTLFGETTKYRKFTGLAFYSWLFALENSPRQIVASDAIPTKENNWSGSNYGGWKNAHVDADIKVIETELDPEKRHDAWVDAQKRYAEDLPVLPLFFPPEAQVLPTWLKGFVPVGLTDYVSLHVEDWHAE